jgi:hypothetical protein
MANGKWQMANGKWQMASCHSLPLSGIYNMVKNFKWNWSRSFGGAYLLSALWQQLHFSGLLEKRIAKRQYRAPICQAVFAMVAIRCLAPSSMLSITEWIEKDVFMN